MIRAQWHNTLAGDTKVSVYACTYSSMSFCRTLVKSVLELLLLLRVLANPICLPYIM